MAVGSGSEETTDGMRQKSIHENLTLGWRKTESEMVTKNLARSETVCSSVLETDQTAHTDACKSYRTAYTAVCLNMNTRGSKHVGDIRIQILIYKIVHFVGMCCKILSQCTVQKTLNSFFSSALWEVDD